MCGICGFVPATHGDARAEGLVTRMCDELVHRGPDSSGVHDSGVATIGIRRLRIIDVRPQADQPLPNEDGSVWAVCNGEIYNYRELRSGLEKRGHRFRAASDSEVLPHLWEEHGPQLVDHLRGMFSLAVVDSRRGEVFVARDRLGIKPLYYTETADGLAFASETKALVAAGFTSRELDPEAVDHYVAFGCVAAPRTMLRGVSALPPGHALHVKDGRHRVYRYWDLPPEGSLDVPRDEVVPRIRELLEDSIRLHCQSDVPLGAFLSGGIDSSAVVGLMSHVTGMPPRTFNVRFSDAPERFDESRHARLAATRFGAEHSEVVLDGAAVRDELERMVWHIDQPSADGINSYFVSKAAAEGGLVVALSGLGGDEVFGGYDTYRLVPRMAAAARLWGRAPSAVRSRAAGALARVGASRETGGRWHKLERFVDVDSVVSLYAVARTLVWPGERARLYGPALHGRNGDGRPDALLAPFAVPGEGPWRTVTRLELRNYMGHRLLRDTDAMSMAHSLEVRVPLIDDALVEFVTGLPGHKRGVQPKPLLVEALGDLLPREITARPKHGFEFPMAHWMRRELREVVDDALSPRSVRDRGVFDPAGVQALYDRFRAGRQEYQSVWQLVMLELWARAYLDRPVA